MENELKRAVLDAQNNGRLTDRQRDRRLGIRYCIFALVSLAVIIGLSVGLGVGLTRHNNTSSSSPSPSPTSSQDIRNVDSIWRPTTGTTWNIALSTVPSTFSASSTRQVYDLDLFDTPKATINNIKASGHKMICYFSAGSYENWRPDQKQFPRSALGKPLDGWPGERWVNTSDPGIRKVMVARLQLAKSKGCDGVDPDNIDGYENDSGLNLTHATAIDYVKFLAQEAHNLGMACGLKNGGEIVPQVVDYVEWEVNEQCAQYNECATYKAFVTQNKPVFQIEYTEQDPPPQAFLTRTCGARTPQGFSTLIKHMKLGTWTATCPSGQVVPF